MGGLTPWPGGGFREYTRVTPPETTSQSAELVAQRFEQASEWGDYLFFLTTGLLEDLGDDKTKYLEIKDPYEFNPPVEIEYPGGITGLNPTVPTPPTINEISVAPVSVDVSPPVYDAVTLNPEQPPVYDVPLPNFILPDAPTDTIPEFLDNAPPARDLIIPEKPNYVIPAVPTVDEVILPPDPTYTEHVFEGQLPIFDIQEPDALFVWNEIDYSSELRDPLLNRLKAGILNGEYVLPPEVESAISARARSRLDSDLEREEDVIRNESAARGARLPPGALIARLDAARHRSIQARTDLDRDILIKSEDLAYQSAEFMVRTGLDMERLLTEHSNQIQSRALDAAKFAYDGAIRIYQAKIVGYQAQLDAYRTSVQVYEAKIRGEIAKADLYRSILESRRLSLEIQGLFIQLYEAQLRGINALAQIYRTEVEAVSLQAQIYGYEVDAYRTKIEAYKAEVDGIVAKYNLYQAQVAGESEKVRFYSEQVKAYGEQVDAYRARSEVDLAVVNAAVANNRGRTDQFRAELDVIEQEIRAAVSNAEIQAQREDLKIRAYGSDIESFTAQVRALTESYNGKVQVELANSENRIRYAEILGRLETAKAELDSVVADGKARVASQLAAAALSSVSAGAHIGYSQSRGDSTSLSVADSQSHAWSTVNSESYSISDSTIKQE